MQYNTKKHREAMEMQDSDSKLGKLEAVGLSLGIFDKESIIIECTRLRAAGYKSPAQRYLESKHSA